MFLRCVPDFHRMGLHNSMYTRETKKQVVGMCKWERRNLSQGPAKWVKDGYNAGTQDDFLSSFGAFLAACFPPNSIWPMSASHT